MKLSLGEAPRKRTKRVLSDLLSLVNSEEHVDVHNDCLGGAQVVKSGPKQLTIKATLRQLSVLISHFDRFYGEDSPDLQNSWSVQEALEHLRLTLGIFSDIRQKRQGSKYWVFRLDLWYFIEDLSGNLEEFERVWESKKESTLSKPFTKLHFDKQVPFQVLLDVKNFVGRRAELNSLAKHLVIENTGLAIVGIYGMGGVGKSTLAKHFAHEYKKSFPDGVLFADLRTQEPAAILESFSGAYGWDIGSRKNLLDKAEFVRTILSQKRSLLILDNANDSEILTYLLPTTGKCSVIVTTRDKDIASLQGFQELILGPLNESESIELLTKIVGRNKILSERIEAVRITEMCGNLPLAVNISGSLIKFSCCSLYDYRFNFENEQQKLNMLEWRTRSLRSSFNITWDLLDDTHKDLLSILSVFEGSNIDIFALAEITQKRPIKLKMEIGGLIAVSLVEINIAQEYKLHPLVKEFATEKLSEKFCDEISGLYHRLALYYLTSLSSGILTFDNINENYGNIIAIIYWTFKNHLYDEFLGFGKNIVDFLIFKGYWSDGNKILRKTIVAAHELGNIQTEFEMRLKLSELCREQANYHDAQEQYEVCKVYFEKTGQSLTLASVIRELGELTRVRRDYFEARLLHRKSLNLYKQLDCESGKAQSLHDLGLIERILGNYTEARKLFLQSLKIHESLGDFLGKAYNNLELGIIARLQKDNGAKELLYSGYKEFDKFGDKRGLAYSLRELGELAVEENRYSEAEELHNQSLRLRQELGDQRGKAISLYRLGRLSQLQRNFALSKKYYLESLAIAQKLDDKLHKAFNLVRLGELASIDGNRILAVENWTQSLELFNEMHVADSEVSEVKALLKC